MRRSSNASTTKIYPRYLGPWWYPPEAMTRLKTPVRVRWGWMPPFIARLEQDAPRRWATELQGKMVWLPPRVQRVWRSTFGGEEIEVTNAWLEGRGWGPEPSAWQPLMFDDWPDPLPEPIKLGVIKDEARMSTIDSLGFDATAAAEEMEREREEARARHDRDAAHEFRPDGKSWDWWRNPALIKYQPRGDVTRDMAEARVLRAVAFCWGDPAIGQLVGGTFAKVLAGAIAEAVGLEGTEPRGIKFAPLQQDHTDFLEAMRWFAQLGEDYGGRKAWSLSRRQEIVALRSLPVPHSFGEIANEFAISKQRAHQLYGRAIDSVLKAANQPDVLDHRIERLRERNRAHKRAAR